MSKIEAKAKSGSGWIGTVFFCVLEKVNSFVAYKLAREMGAGQAFEILTKLSV